MHPLPQLRFQFPQFGPHPVTPSLPHQQEMPLPAASADMGESQKVERFRFAQSTSGSPNRCMADVRKPNNRATSAMLGFVPQPNLRLQLRFLG